jgi:hypothetical protein
VRGYTLAGTISAWVQPPRFMAEISGVSGERTIESSLLYGAGDGNRTHVRSLGSFYTAIVRRPLWSLACRLYITKRLRVQTGTIFHIYIGSAALTCSIGVSPVYFLCAAAHTVMRSGWLSRVASVSACQSDHFSWIAAHNILPPSQQSCVPFVGEEQQDSSRTTPTSDCNHDETRAFRLGETPGPSGPDARMHMQHTCFT